MLAIWNALGQLVCPAQGVLRPLGAVSGPLGAVLAASWSLLRRSWGGLGAVLGPLGPSWMRSKTTQNDMPQQERFKMQQGALRLTQPPDFLTPSWEPKTDQNRIQNESKFQTMFKSEKFALQEPLGAVLGRSWAILEGILGSQISLRYRQA